MMRYRGVRRVVTVALLAVGCTACGLSPDRIAMEEATALTQGGDPQRGRILIREYGCNTCHTIPGVRGARGSVGPPLTGIAGRMYIAGLLTNTPENLMRWIRDPPGVDSLTAMPDVGVTEPDARDIAAYLYTLR